MINSIHVFSFTGVSEFNWSQITAHFSSAGPAQSKTGEMMFSVAYALSLSACATPSLSIGGEIVTLRLFETDLFSDICFFVPILSTITFFSTICSIFGLENKVPLPKRSHSCIPYTSDTGYP